jgi:hypothetical protein
MRSSKVAREAANHQQRILIAERGHFANNGKGQFDLDRDTTTHVLRRSKTRTKGNSMICKRFATMLMLIGLWAVSFSASAQVVTFGFTQTQAAAIATPLSPWMAGATAVMLGLAAWVFLRRRRGAGLLLVALAVLGGFAIPETQEAKAKPSCTSLTQPNAGVGCLALTAPSPNVTADYRFSVQFSFGFIDVSNGTGTPLTVTNIQLSSPWATLDPSTYNGGSLIPGNFTLYLPLCTVGSSLAVGGHCSLYLVNNG